ncbi:hypothetical protein FRC08_004228 [Ceratobasidium sp. 394]|nr:hypothetical protein FRC08_004228 [Ceratobasidium sp. 394]KAG9092175.1 hypothetical protein FS749_015946 [Ceratobasidium sp. UAMH 11750]
MGFKLLDGGLDVLKKSMESLSMEEVSQTVEVGDAPAVNWDKWEEELERELGEVQQEDMCLPKTEDVEDLSVLTLD